MNLIFIGKKKRGVIFEGGFYYKGHYINRVSLDWPQIGLMGEEEYLIEGMCTKVEAKTLYINATRVISLHQLELCPQS